MYRLESIHATVYTRVHVPRYSCTLMSESQLPNGVLGRSSYSLAPAPKPKNRGKEKERRHIIFPCTRPQTSFWFGGGLSTLFSSLEKRTAPLDPKPTLAPQTGLGAGAREYDVPPFLFFSSVFWFGGEKRNGSNTTSSAPKPKNASIHFFSRLPVGLGLGEYDDRP